MSYKKELIAQEELYCEKDGYSFYKKKSTFINEGGPTYTLFVRGHKGGYKQLSYCIPHTQRHKETIEYETNLIEQLLMSIKKDE